MNNNHNHECHDTVSMIVIDCTTVFSSVSGKLLMMTKGKPLTRRCLLLHFPSTLFPLLWSHTCCELWTENLTLSLHCKKKKKKKKQGGWGGLFFVQWIQSFSGIPAFINRYNSTGWRTIQEKLLCNQAILVWGIANSPESELQNTGWA